MVFGECRSVVGLTWGGIDDEIKSRMDGFVLMLRKSIKVYFYLNLF